MAGPLALGFDHYVAQQRIANAPPLLGRVGGELAEAGIFAFHEQRNNGYQPLRQESAEMLARLVVFHFHVIQRLIGLQHLVAQRVGSGGHGYSTVML